jgi:hypothetical protein
MDVTQTVKGSKKRKAAGQPKQEKAAKPKKMVETEEDIKSYVYVTINVRGHRGWLSPKVAGVFRSERDAVRCLAQNMWGDRSKWFEYYLSRNAKAERNADSRRQEELMEECLEKHVMEFYAKCKAKYEDWDPIEATDAISREITDTFGVDPESHDAHADCVVCYDDVDGVILM